MNPLKDVTVAFASSPKTSENIKIRSVHETIMLGACFVKIVGSVVRNVGFGSSFCEI